MKWAEELFMGDKNGIGQFGVTSSVMKVTVDPRIRFEEQLGDQGSVKGHT